VEPTYIVDRMELIELLSIDIDVAPIVDLGDSGTGVRRLIPFHGGTFAGRGGLSGTLAPGGADWQFVRGDSTIEIDAHYVLETDGGARLEVRSTGIRVAAPEVIERITAGDPVDPSEYYFRTHIRLTSADESLRWVNDVIAVSAGERRRSSVRINVFELT
jgi:Protein of unknown function (DUF3237)